MPPVAILVCFNQSLEHFEHINVNTLFSLFPPHSLAVELCSF